jgi:DNA primase
VRTAIALLLQHPGLAGTAADPSAEFQALQGRPGVALLLDLIQLLRDRPDIKTGSIIEHYRDSEHKQSLAKLVTWEHPTLSGDVETEFRGVLEQLRREARWAETEQLMNKERLSGLTSAEKIELKRLLAEKGGGRPV